jgi:DNA (cytosine-5)-methyltransferase 1
MHLFAGIGGAALGFERAGFTPAVLCDIDPACQKVLRKHWPHALLHDNVCTLHTQLQLDVITGGFPCQDISLAGPGAGLKGERSRLWFEQLRLVKEVRPKYVVAENSPALRSRGLEEVLRSLAAIGYDAEWHCLPACFLGAWHKRDRIWILAYPSGSPQSLEAPLLRQQHLSTTIGRIPPKWPGRSNLPSPTLCRTGNGLPGRLDRNTQLGNSIYVPVAELIATRIMATELLLS